MYNTLHFIDEKTFFISNQALHFQELRPKYITTKKVRIISE